MAPQGDKSSYTTKQRRQARHIEESVKSRGGSSKRAKRIAYATVNKQDGGGKKSGSGRGRKRDGLVSRLRRPQGRPQDGRQVDPLQLHEPRRPKLPHALQPGTQDDAQAGGRQGRPRKPLRRPQGPQVRGDGLRYRDHFGEGRPPRDLQRIPPGGALSDTFTRPVTRKRPPRPRARRFAPEDAPGEGAAQDILRRVDRRK
ncbi:MAG TPA: hypothetical protein VFH47_05435 [Candidatus Thermoplasmatota archaeon]|nr:hypothetical protein [Candidatus Thermoplasmatota archaeon]